MSVRPLLLLALLVSSAVAGERPTLRLCTGRKGDPYARAGAALAQRLEEQVKVEVVETRGSWENLESIDATPRRCDAIIAQEDAYTLYEFEQPSATTSMERLSALYPEQVHLLCNRKVQANSALELDPDRHRVVVSEYGSGAYITWSLFAKLNPAWGKLKGREASVEDGLLKIVDGADAQCLVIVSGVGGLTLSSINERLGSALRLLPVVDPALGRAIGRERRVVYQPSVIPPAAYPSLTTNAIQTVSVSAVFFVSPEWKAKNPEAARHLSDTLLGLVPELAAPIAFDD